MNRRSARNRHRRDLRGRVVISTRVVWHSPDHFETVTESGSIGVVDFMPLIDYDRPGAGEVTVTRKAELHTEHPMLSGTARIE